MESKTCACPGCIVDPSPVWERCGVIVDDIAKRQIDDGSSAPITNSLVAGALVIEAIKSELKVEIHHCCEAMIGIRREIAEVEAGRFKIEDWSVRHARTPCTTRATPIGSTRTAASKRPSPAGATRQDKY